MTTQNNKAGGIKICGFCGKYYLGNKPHFEKSSKCGELDDIREKFLKQNNVPSWEVWNMTIGTEDYMIGFRYDAEQSLRNFMKLVGEKLELK